MPTFVYLPHTDRWINMERVITVRRVDGRVEVNADGLVDDDGRESLLYLTTSDGAVFLRALSKLTPKELT